MRVLWLKSELLHPVDRGGRIRTYQMLRQLARRHEVTYLCLDDARDRASDAVALAAEYAHEVVTVPFAPPPKGGAAMYADLARSVVTSGEPYAIWKYRSDGFRTAFDRLAASGRFDVCVCDFLVPAVNLPARLPLPMVLFQHNVEAEIWRRHFETSTGPKRWLYRGQWARMQAFEREVCRRMDHVVAVSEADREHFARVYGVEGPTAVATGVDTDAFRPSGGVPRIPGRLVFTGQMNWMPNEDGMQWFAAEIWPRIRAAVPGATLDVVGRDPTPAIRRLAERGDGITVTGRVPQVQPYLERASAAVVPLRVGGGTRLKIYEALAMECPLVSTAVGAEGLPVEDGRHCRLADDPAAFADACIALLREPAAAEAMGRRAATWVRERFSWAAVTEGFTATCERVAASRGSSPGVLAGAAR